MPEPILQIERISVRYEDTTALDDVSFVVNTGDLVAIIGPNGAGKSTLLQAIMGLIQPQQGSIQVDRRRLGYVPQHQSIDWTYPVTVRDVVMMGLVQEIGWLRWPRKRHWMQVEAALERVGMADQAGRQIGDLSGGQRQRIFIARTLVQKADTLLLDEPFAGVDIAAQSGLMQIIEDLNRSDGLTILLTTHDLSLAFNRFQQVMALNRRLIAFGAPQTITTPQTMQALYGGAVATLQQDTQTLLFVDDDTHCCP